MDRIKLNKKYYKYGNPAKNKDPKYLISYYKKYQDVLLELINELNNTKEDISIIKNDFNIRQTGCIKRCSKEFVDNIYKDKDEKFTQAFYEIMDFIYYPEFKYNDLARNEIDTIKMMASYLIFKAGELIYEIEKGLY